MTNECVSSGYGVGRIEVRANLEAIKIMMTKGHHFKYIHKYLAENKKITVPYSTFLYHVKGELKSWE
ncbi:MAG: TraK family protein [Deltaproteobacteria bacterium]|jgi:hypothetical protein|nr:TraK family protein [Deltaproteobacteria bacterium]